jgi:hypothetical protein
MNKQCETSRRWKRGLLASAVVAMTFAASTASGAFLSFTATGTGNDGPLSAQADFTTSDGQLMLTLTNLLTADEIRSAGQALSDISFDLSDAIGTVGTTTASGQFGDVDSTPQNGGVATYVSADTQTGNTTPIRWFTNGTFGATSITLEAIGGGKPSQMIAPFIANGGTYTNVNNGFEQFNSYIIGPGTFTLALPGVTGNTSISNVVFSFGTGPDTLVPGVPIPGIPEPGPLALIALGLVALAASQRKRH